MLRIKLVKSPIGNTAQNRKTVKALGLRKLQHMVEHEDSASIRGMVHRVKHLLQVEITEGTPKTAKAPMAAKPAAAAVAKAEAPKAETKEAAVKKPAAKKPAAKKPAPKKESEEQS